MYSVVCETTNKDLLLSANTQLALGYLFGSFFYGKKQHTRNLETCCGMQWGVPHLQSRESQELQMWQGTNFETIFNWEWLSSGNYYSRKGN